MKKLLVAVLLFIFFQFSQSAPIAAATYYRPGRNPMSPAIRNAGSEAHALQIARSKGWRLFQLKQDSVVPNFGASGEFVANALLPAGAWLAEYRGRVYLVGYTDSETGVWYGCGNLTTLIPPSPVETAPQTSAQAQAQTFNIQVTVACPTGPSSQALMPTGGQHAWSPGGSMMLQFLPSPGDTNINVQGGTAISSSTSSSVSSSNASANSQAQAQNVNSINIVNVNGDGSAGAGSSNAAGSQTQNQ